MTKAYKLSVENNSPVERINSFFKNLLKEGIVDSLLVPQESPTGKMTIQTLVRNEKDVTTANPFVPVLLSNSASLVGQLTLDTTSGKIGVVLRSCEIRAAVELSKIKQVNLENVIIIGVDCMGTYESNTFRDLSQKFENTAELTNEYLSNTVNAKAKLLEDKELRIACRGCEHPTPENSDITINFLGKDIKKEIIIQISDKVDAEKLGLDVCDDISSWEKASESCTAERIKFRDKVFEETLNIAKDTTELLKEFEHCRRCYNCRKECPICYCRECIFDSKTFEHASSQYFNWAERKGKIRMPTDTLLFHLTRLNHMVISCVACGQCTSACPNDIPVAELFKTIGHKVQAIFEYEPGKNIDEEIPQSTFKEDEFNEVGTSS